MTFQRRQGQEWAWELPELNRGEASLEAGKEAEVYHGLAMTWKVTSILCGHKKAHLDVNDKEDGRLQ